ncbi:MAG: amino acid permease [Bacteroidota bacterium]|nr:amino acid permease [Bacteroidota bacterium]
MQTKKLTLTDGVMLVAGSMIGSGIFIVSADIARNVGGGGWLLLTWLLAGLMTIMAALSYGELAGMMPKAGGQYIYLKEAYNPMIGFLYGWTLFTVIQTGTIAAVGVAFAKFTGVIFPVVSEKNILMELGGLKISAAQILAILSIVLLSWFNSRGIKQGSILQKLFTTTKLVALFGLILIGLFSFDSAVWQLNWNSFWAGSKISQDATGLWSVSNLTGMALISALGVSMVGTLFSADAWNNVTFVSGEMENPSKNVAKSMVTGTLIVTGIYILTNIVYMGLLPMVGSPDGPGVIDRGIQFALNDRVGTAAAFQIFGDSSLYLMAILIMISTFGCNNGLILSGARVYQAMAIDKLFFRQAAELNSYQVPAKALWFQCAWTCALCLSGTYGNLLDYVVFAVLLFYILTVAGVIVLRTKNPNAERPYRTIGYPLIPILYIVLAVIICVLLLIYKPAFTWPGLGIVLLGIPVYYWVNKSRNIVSG